MKLKQFSFKIISMVMVFTMLFGMSATTINAVAEGMDLNFFTLRSANSVSTNDPLVYVSIGDSMTNGYGLDGYDGESGIMNYGNDVYANQFAAWLAGYTGEITDDQTVFTGSNGTVDHRQLAMSGMRAEDLAWLLNLNCTDDNYAKMLVRFKNDPWSFTWDGKSYSGFEHEWGGGREYWYSHDVTDPDQVINGYGFTSGDWRTWTDLLDPDYRLADGAAKILSMYGTNGFVSNSVSINDDMITDANTGLTNNDNYPTSKSQIDDLFGAEGRWLRFVTEFYQDSVADADIITLALGNTNFGTFMFDTIKDIFFNPTAKNWFPSRYHIDEVYLMAEAVGVSDELMSMIEELVEDELNPILEEQFGDLADEPLPETVVDGSKTDPYGLLESYTKGALIKYIIKYCVLSYIVSYIDALDRIVELNPDVELVQIALMNAYKTENESDVADGTSFADVIDKIYAPMNAFISMLPGYLASKNAEKYENATFYYADAGTVETLSSVFGNDFYTYDGEDITYDEYQTMLANGDLDVTKLGHNDSTIRERFHHWLASSQGCYQDRNHANGAQNCVACRGYLSYFYLILEMYFDRSVGKGTSWGWCDVTSYGEMWKGLLGPLECDFPDWLTTKPSETPEYQDEYNEWLNAFNSGSDMRDTSLIKKFFNEYRLTYVTEQDIINYEKMSLTERNALLNGAHSYERDLAFSCAMYLAFEDATIRAGKESFMVDDLTGVSGLGYDTFGGAVELFAEKMGITGGVIVGAESAIGSIDANTLTKNFSDALVEDGPSATMLCLANRMQIGTGIGGHPSEGGHDSMAVAIQDAYDAGNTGEEIPKEFMLSYLASKYPEAMVKLGAISELTKSDDLTMIVTMLKISQKNGNAALADVDLDALEATIRTSLKNFEASKTPAQVAAAQADIKNVMSLLWTLAAKATGSNYEVSEDSLYVSLGDSNVNGYGLDGYISGTNGGHGQKVPGAGPVMLAKALYGENWENHFRQYAMGSLRSEDMLYLLGGNVVIDDYYTSEVEWRVLGNYASIEDAQAAYIDAIANADLISINIGGGNVTTFTGEQVDRAVAGEALVEMDWAKIGFEAESMAQLDAMLDEMVPLVDTLGLMNKYLPDGMDLGAAGTAQFARVLLESLLYGYASYNHYYPQVLERIREINPDAQLLILGMFNPIDDWSVEMNGETLPIGGIANNVINSVNMQNLVYALQNPNTTFVDLSETESILDDAVEHGEAEYSFETYYQSILVGDGKEAHASADGHLYMLDQMSAALNGNDYTAELDALVENIYAILNDSYLTTQEKLDLLGDIFKTLKDSGKLVDYPELSVVGEIYNYLDSKRYISDEQTLEIALYVYALVLDGELSDDDMTEIGKFVYETLVHNALLTDADRVAIVGNVYSILKDNDYLDNYAALKVVEEIYVALDEAGLITDSQAYAIVDYVYDVIADGEVTELELLDTVRSIYYILIKNEAPVVRYARSRSVDPAVAKAAATLRIVLNAVAENYLDDANKASMATLVTGNYALIGDQLLFDLAENLIAVLEENGTSDKADLAAKASDAVVATVMNDTSTSDSVKVLIIKEFNKVTENNGAFGGEDGNDDIFDLAVIEKIYENLKNNDLLNDAQVMSILKYLYSMLGSVDTLDPEQVADVIAYVCGVVFTRDDLNVEDKIDIVGIVYDTLKAEGYITEKNIETVLGYLDQIIAEYYDEAYAYAYEYLYDYIVIAKEEIRTARSEIKNLIVALRDAKVTDAELNKLKTELIGELMLLDVTLGEVSNLLNHDKIDAENVKTAIDELRRLETLVYSHYDNLVAIVKIALPMAKEQGEIYLAEKLEELDAYVKNELVPNVKLKLKQLAKDLTTKIYEYIADNTGFIYDELVELIAETVEYYTDAEKAELLSKWLVKNKATILALYDKYGPEAFEFLKDNHEEIVEFLSLVLDEYSEEILDVIAAHAEVILPVVVDWMNMHGEYATELVKSFITTIYNSFKALVGSDGNAVHPNFTELAAAYDRIMVLVEELVDMMSLENFTYAQAKELIKALEVELLGLDTIVKDIVMEAVKDLNDLAGTQNDYAENALEALDLYLKETLKLHAKLAVNALIDYAKDAVRGEYIPDSESDYVYIDSTLFGSEEDAGYKSYAELLKDYIEGKYDNEFGYKVKLHGMTWDTLNYNTLANAGLISVGFNENQLSEFAIQQMLGYVEDYLNGDIRETANEFSDELIAEVLKNLIEKNPELNFLLGEPEKLLAQDWADALINGTVDALVGEGELPTEIVGEFTATELLAIEMIGSAINGKDYVELDWAALVGEDNVGFVESALEILRDELLENGINETKSYEFNLVTEESHKKIIDLFNGIIDKYTGAGTETSVAELKETLAIIEDYEQFQTLFGDYSKYVVKIPVLDAIMSAAESYLYSHIEFQIQYGNLISKLNEINPDATLVLLGHYNPFDMEFNFMGETVDLTDAYACVAGIASVQPFVYALLSEKILYVDIYNAETNFDYFVGEGDVLELLLMYLNGNGPTDLSPDGHKFVADQIKELLQIGCNHEGMYDNACDTDCNRCGAIRVTPPHVYSYPCDPDCNICGAIRDVDHVYGEDGKCIYCGHEQTTGPIYPVVPPTPKPELDPLCANGTHYFDDDCEDTTCYKCSFVRDPQSHDFDCEGQCTKCSKKLDVAPGHTYSSACDDTCDRCNFKRTVPGHKYTDCLDATCNLCGATRATLKHSFGDWKVIREATRESKGYEYHVCKICGLREIKIVAAFGTLSGGAIAGIVIGSVVVAGAAGFAIYWFLIQKKTFAALIEAIKSLTSKLGATPATAEAGAAVPAAEEAAPVEEEAPATEEETK